MAAYQATSLWCWWLWVLLATLNPPTINLNQQQTGNGETRSASIVQLVEGQQNGEVLVSSSSSPMMNNQFQIANNNRKQIYRRHLVAENVGANLMPVEKDVATLATKGGRLMVDGGNYGTNNVDGSDGSGGNQIKTIQFLNVNGQPVLVQFTYVGPPKILPIATADSYPEGSTINLICTVSGGQRKGLTLGWIKDGRELSEDLVGYSGDGPNDLANVSIEKTGADISILRVSNATHANSGRFTCTAKNPLGEDSTSVNIVINVELKWNKLPADTEIGLNKDLSLECDAIGQPEPQISWFKHPSGTSTKLGRPTASGLNDTNSGKMIVVSQNKFLKITKAQNKDSGLYECLARNGVDQDLRRIIQVKVRGK